jgi:hypothetical protein
LLVRVGVSVPHGKARISAGQAVPPLVTAHMLIDTGASGCALDHAIIAQLGLQPTGSAPIHTPSTGGTPHTALLFDVAFQIVNDGGHAHVIPAIPVMACDFAAQGIGGLFGRDALGEARLTYAGMDGLFLLSF